MASLTLADAASRAGPMTETKKPKRWEPKTAKAAQAHEVARSDPNESRKSGPLTRPSMTLPSSKTRSNLYRKD